MALWAAFTYTIDASDTAPYLGVTSATRRCGKTTLLGLITGVVRRPFPTANMTSAATFRSIERFEPTLVIDEAETFLHGNNEIRGILNSGHTRATAYVVRCVGDDYTPTRFSTWCAKVFGLIGRLRSTLEDRSIIIRMRRQVKGARAERFRQSVMKPQLLEWQSQSMRWSQDHLEELRQADPDIPDALHDRAADNWRPLLAIADAVGGEWPERASAAALALYSEDDADTGVLLLQDIRDLFGDHAGPESAYPGRLASGFIVEKLGEMEDRPWPEWRYRMPMTPTQLADALEPFDIAPMKIRFGDRSVRGYQREWFDSVFASYFPEAEQTEQPEQDADDEPEFYTDIDWDRVYAKVRVPARGGNSISRAA